MNFTKANLISFYLSLAAAIVTIIGCTLHNTTFSSLRFGLSNSTVAFLSLLVGILTFLFAYSGLRILKSKYFTPWKSAALGFLFGLMTLLTIVSVATLLFIPSLEYLWRGFKSLFYLVFIYGGFLGPIVGAFTAYHASNNRNDISVFE